MTIDFTTDINNVKRKMRKFINDNQPVPRDILDHYTKLLTGTLTARQLESNTSNPTTPGSNSPVSYQGTLQYNSTVVATTNSLVLSADSGRSYILIQNIGNETVYLSIGGVSAVEEGIAIVAGGSWSSDIAQFATSSFSAITNANTSKITMHYLTTTPIA